MTKINYSKPRGAQTHTLLLFCNCNLEINPVTFKLEGDLDILKMYPHTENEAEGIQNLELELKKIRTHVSRSEGRVRMSKVPN